MIHHRLNLMNCIGARSGSLTGVSPVFVFDVSFTHKELSRVFNQYNEYAEHTVLLRTLACLIRTKVARIVMDSGAMHNYKSSPTRRQHDDIDSSLYEIACRYNLDAQDSSIPSLDNEPTV